MEIQTCFYFSCAKLWSVCLAILFWGIFYLSDFFCFMIHLPHTRTHIHTLTQCFTDLAQTIHWIDILHWHVLVFTPHVEFSLTLDLLFFYAWAVILILGCLSLWMLFYLILLHKSLTSNVWCKRHNLEEKLGLEIAKLKTELKSLELTQGEYR